MKSQYGPWATLIDAGGNPQLSAFWRRRLTMLVPTSQTSPVLSRRNLLWLGAAATLLLALPTFRSAPAVAEENKPANEATPGHANKAKQQVPAADSGLPATDPYNGLPAYAPLCHADVRKTLNLSSEQERKLREINATFRPHWQVFRDALRLGGATAEWDAAQAKFRQEANAVRKQIEQLLTAEQLTAIRQIVLQGDAAGLNQQPHMREKLGLTAQQEKELDRLAREQEEKMWQFARDAAEKALAVLSPQQRQRLEFEANTETVSFSRGRGGPAFTPYIYLEWAGVQKETGLDDEQRSKLRTISAKYTPIALQELPKLRKEAADPLTKSRKAKPVQEKLLELGKRMRVEIDAVLTPQQLATLKKITTDQYLSAVVTIPRILKEIDASQKQQDELRRLRDERGKMLALQTSIREAGKKSLAVLTPQQRETFREEIDRHRNWLISSAVFSSSDYPFMTITTGHQAPTKKATDATGQGAANSRAKSATTVTFWKAKSVTVFPIVLNSGAPIPGVSPAMSKNIAEMVGLLLERGGMKPVEIAAAQFSPPKDADSARLAAAFGSFVQAQKLKTDCGFTFGGLLDVLHAPPAFLGLAFERPPLSLSLSLR